MSDLCKCTMSIRVLGDGCRHCQPQGYIDRLEDQAKDHYDRIIALEAVLRQAREALSMLNGDERVYKNPIDVDDEIAAIYAALKE